MKVFHSPASRLHDPDRYFRRGLVVEHPEQARRYDILLDAVAGRHIPVEARDHGLDPARTVHDPDYIAFLRDAWGRRAELPDTVEEITSGHFARPHMHARPEGLLGLIGYHMADTSTPIRPRTFEAIVRASHAAADAADAAVSESVAYALCRPPGHHAYADSAGGFCFFNNTAIAAQRLRDSGHSRVAVLDIDVHHGNGTQGIFYERGDVLTVSVHADPSNFFPYYAGHADETGRGEGAGRNLNLPLAHGSGDTVFHDAIEEGLVAIAAFGAHALVVALGLDASKDDPIGALAVTTEGFARAARLIASAGLPTAIIQEGGYLCEALPRNLSAFLDAFDESRPRNSL